MKLYGEALTNAACGFHAGKFLSGIGRKRRLWYNKGKGGVYVFGNNDRNISSALQDYWQKSFFLKVKRYAEANPDLFIAFFTTSVTIFTLSINFLQYQYKTGYLNYFYIDISTLDISLSLVSVFHAVLVAIAFFMLIVLDVALFSLFIENLKFGVWCRLRLFVINIGVTCVIFCLFKGAWYGEDVGLDLLLFVAILFAALILYTLGELWVLGSLILFPFLCFAESYFIRKLLISYLTLSGMEILDSKSGMEILDSKMVMVAFLVISIPISIIINGFSFLFSIGIVPLPDNTPVEASRRIASIGVKIAVGVIGVIVFVLFLLEVGTIFKDSGEDNAESKKEYSIIEDATGYFDDTAYDALPSSNTSDAHLCAVLYQKDELTIIAPCLESNVENTLYINTDYQQRLSDESVTTHSKTYDSVGIFPEQ